jgi:Rx N-terminal domain
MAAELFLSPLIELATEKAASALIKHFCQMRDMEENRKKLHFKLAGIQEVIGDAEKQGENKPFVKTCLKKLHAAACEAVDVLDEFQYEALRWNAMNQQASASKKVTLYIYIIYIPERKRIKSNAFSA